MSSKLTQLKEFSNPEFVSWKAQQMGLNPVYESSRKDKKYMVLRPDWKWVHFGQMGYEDYTKHKNKTRRKNYLTRSAKIRGNWKKNKYSANNLARNLLW